MTSNSKELIDLAARLECAGINVVRGLFNSETGLTNYSYRDVAYVANCLTIAAALRARATQSVSEDDTHDQPK